MRQDLPDKQFLCVEMNHGNEPILVPADVEHVEAFPACTNIVNTLEGLFEFREISEMALARGLIPAFQGCLRVGMNPPEFR